MGKAICGRGMDSLMSLYRKEIPPGSGLIVKYGLAATPYIVGEDFDLHIGDETLPFSKAVGKKSEWVATVE